MRSWNQTAACALAGILLASSTFAGPSSELEAMTGDRTVVVWMRDETNNVPNTDPDAYRLSCYILMGLDTDDGAGERVIQGDVSSYWSPMVTSGGDRVVWTDHPNQKIYSCNFDGSNKHELGPGAAVDLWRDPDTGVGQIRRIRKYRR
jgi:hypothetical protein